MRAFGSAGEGDDLNALTDKQCEVLDLLIEHKTSKEIARALGISPHTVDQRISLARGRLGVSSRNELAALYRSMRDSEGQSQVDLPAFSAEKNGESVYDRGIYGSPAIDQADGSIHRRERQEDNHPKASVPSVREKKICPTPAEMEHRVGPEVFEGSSAGLWRMAAIVATALLLVVTVLVLFAIFDQLSDLLA